MAAQLAGAGEMRIIFDHMLPGFLSHLIVSGDPGHPRHDPQRDRAQLSRPGPAPAGDQLGRAVQRRRTCRPSPSALAAGPRRSWSLSRFWLFNFVGDGLRDAADPYK